MITELTAHYQVKIRPAESMGVVNGGCLCGFVRYEYDGELGPANYCHCNDCKRTTGSAFNIGIKAYASALRVVSGRVKGYTKTGGSGNAITRQFCPECGSPLFTRTPAKPQFVWIKAGSLDDSGLVRPTYQIWTDRKVPWSHIDAELPNFPGNRTNSSEILQKKGNGEQGTGNREYETKKT